MKPDSNVAHPADVSKVIELLAENKPVTFFDLLDNEAAENSFPRNASKDKVPKLKNG